MQQKSLSAPAFLGRAAAAFAATFVLLFVLLFAACCVPGAPVRRNIARSVPLLQQEGLYPEYFGFKLFQMDNYTDTYAPAQYAAFPLIYTYIHTYEDIMSALAPVYTAMGRSPQ